MYGMTPMGVFFTAIFPPEINEQALCQQPQYIPELFSNMVNFSRALFGHLYDHLSGIICVRETNDQSLFLHMLEKPGDLAVLTANFSLSSFG